MLRLSHCEVPARPAHGAVAIALAPCVTARSGALAPPLSSSPLRLPPPILGLQDGFDCSNHPPAREQCRSEVPQHHRDLLSSRVGYRPLRAQRPIWLRLSGVRVNDDAGSNLVSPDSLGDNPDPYPHATRRN